MAYMTTIDTSTLSNQNISSALLVHTFTNTTRLRKLYITVLADQLAGNGDYVVYCTRQISGAGSAYEVGGRTTVAVPSGVTAQAFPTIALMCGTTDVIKIYVDGLAGDTTTPDIITNVAEEFIVTDSNGRADIGAMTGTTLTARDIGASVLLSSGTGTGQLDFTSGVVKANLAQILGTALTETSGQIAAAFKKFFDKATPTGTINSIPDAVAGASGGLFIAGSNAATTANITGNLTGNVSGSVGSVTGAVGSVTGAVGSVTGNVGGNVTGSVGSVASGGIAAASFAAGAITAAVIATDAIDADALADNAITAATFAAGAITATVIATDAIDADALADNAITAATFAAGAITATVIATDAIDNDAIAANAVTEIQSGLATAAAIAALNNLSAAQVNAEVVDALATDTYAEPASVPAATASLKDKLNWLFTLARNKVTMTSTTQTLRNDADGGNIATSTHSDDATTYTRGEWS